MIHARIPSNDNERLSALYEYDILGSAREPAFGALTAAAAHILKMPCSVISLVDRDRQWFKSCQGTDATESPRNISFCGHVVANQELLIVTDATTDERFSDNPFVTGPEHLRFYAGIPLRTTTGFVLGALCVTDTEPREISNEQIAILTTLADQVMAQLELRRINRLLSAQSNELHLFETFFNQSVDLLCVADMDGRLRQVNGAWGRVLGWSVEELRTMSFVDLMHPDDVEPSMTAVKEGLANGGKTTGYVNRYRHKDGRWVYLSWVGSIEGPRIFASARDVTEDRARAKELVVAREQALAASIAKSEFLASMSHELRTPLTGTIGMADLALRCDLPPDAKEYIQTARESAFGLVSIVNDILDLSKIEAGKFELSRATFSLRDVLVEALRPLAVRGLESNTRVLALPLIDLPEYVEGDALRLKQVLVNLLGNALKFSKGGTIRVSVERAAGEFIRFHVADEGIGIDPSQLGYIFEAFAQADQSNHRSHGGTGLGLAICKRLCHLMGGAIWVESTLGVGSTFSFEIALPAIEKRGTNPIPTLTDRRVLVVDSDPVHRAAIVHMLRQVGVDAEGVDLENAFAKLRAVADRGDGYEAIVTDSITNPNYAAIEQEVGRLPRVLATRAGAFGAAARFRAAGFSACLTKPLTANVLLRAIGEALGLDAASEAGTLIIDPLTRNGRPSPVRALRVLVAEDNRVNQVVIRRLLEDAGHQVTVVNDGREAVSVTAAETFDLIFMDVEMPGMDGLTATRAIRTSQAGTGLHIPIFALTAHAMQGDEVRCLSAGMDGYITKPIDVSRLEEVVRSVAVPEDSPVSMRTPERADSLPPLLDIDGTLLRLNGDASLLLELIAIGFEELPKSMTNIEKALTSGSTGPLGRAAHALRGMLLNLGATATALLTEKLESEANEGSLAKAEATFIQLQESVAALRRPLAEAAKRLATKGARTHPPSNCAPTIR